VYLVSLHFEFFKVGVLLFELPELRNGHIIDFELPEEFSEAVEVVFFCFLHLNYRIEIILKILISFSGILVDRDSFFSCCITFPIIHILRHLRHDQRYP
jgi:hypothetical protein